MKQEFPAATGAPTFYRTYSRRVDGNRENYTDVTERTSQGLAKVGEFTAKEFALVADMMEQKITLPSGRWMWVGGTSWIENPENYYSAYNCNSTNINNLESFGLMMALGMMGCGTGAVLEDRYISQLPPVRNSLQVRVVGKPGQHSVRLDDTHVELYELDAGLEIEIVVGDSRQGWVDSMMTVLRLGFEELLVSGKTFNHANISVDLSSVRPDGTPIKGFGGVANPIKLSRMYERVATVLNRYVGQQLDAEGVCLLLDEPALTIVAGNVRRYAGMRQFGSDAPLLKENLWVQDADGTWRINPERDALRMSNHSRVYHHKPSQPECVEAVRKQYYSGEGAIQWAGEAVARANADLLDTREKKQEFLRLYCEDRKQAMMYLATLLTKSKGIEMKTEEISLLADELEHRMQRLGLNPCGIV
jgi:ribonucleotide reductase class II